MFPPPHWCTLSAGATGSNARFAVARQVTPTGRPLDPDSDYRQPLDPHRAELRIARPEQHLRLIVLIAAFENFPPPAQHDPAEPRPVLVVAIDHQRDRRIFQDIAHPLE